MGSELSNEALIIFDSLNKDSVMRNFGLFTKRLPAIFSSAAQNNALIYADNNEQQDNTLLHRLMNRNKEHDTSMREPLGVSPVRSRRR